jgi:membrane protease YdiL (CAAX protease family)
MAIDSPASPAPAPDTKEEKVHLTFPDYQWSARDAFKCLVLLFMLNYVVLLFHWILDVVVPGFRGWYATGLGYFSWRVFHYGLNLVVAAYFARTETLSAFWQGFGLNRKPSEYVWIGFVCVLAIRFFGHFMIIHGWAMGVSNYDIHAFRTAIGPERYLFLVPLVLLAPLFEESVYRGFLYKAFRGSFPISISMALLLGWNAWTHWNQYSQSWVAAFDLSLFTILQCYLREKSDSLWDCIFCHVAFNGSSLFIGAILR